ncbi:nitrate/nitrite transporter NrtS, partial [Alphaproteobacteria bacterium]|nr:nitrate/nitrite transporter NrtS [Alphaproteobacteria bacterium]
MASIVGIVLAIINHGDHILLGTMTYKNWIK